MKIIAFYLPQFHIIPENDEWWGKEFTEWVNVKKALPLYDGHEQPREPLYDNYYNLLNTDIQKWQVDLAKKYGIYGFCYYHYWFNGKLLLEKPMENMLHNKELDLPFCISWANEPWTKAWVGESKKVLIPQKYGDKKEWKEHFDYLLPFFRDKRYIKYEKKPLFIIYRPETIECLNQMLDYWDELAKVHGFNGMTYAYQNIDFDLQKNCDNSRFEYDIEFEPSYAYHDIFKNNHKYIKAMRLIVSNFLEKRFGINLMKIGVGYFNKSNQISYDKAWEMILKRKPISSKSVPGAFVGWDNTPRHGEKGKIYIGDNPEKFQKYLSHQIKRAKNVYHKDIIFMYAWNEWAEGGYLEPDKRHGYKNLEAIKNALLETQEFPDYTTN